MYLPTSRNSIGFFVTMLTMAMLVMGLEGYVFARYISTVEPVGSATGSTTSSRAIPTYFALFLFAEIFGLLVAWDSLRLKNTIQIIGLCIYHVALLVYAIIQIDQIKEALGSRLVHDSKLWGLDSAGSIEPWLVAIPIIIGIGVLIMSYFVYKLYEEFGWTIYKHIGADLAMRRRFMFYQIFIALLKFDFIFFVGFTIQFTVIILDVADPEFGLTVAVIPITILGLLFTSWALRNEKMWGMCVTLAYFVCAMAYFLFKLTRMYTGPKSAFYGNAKRPLAVFAILTLGLLVLSIANAGVCMRNFNCGLKNYVRQRCVRNNPESSPESCSDSIFWYSPHKEIGPILTHRLELD